MFKTVNHTGLSVSSVDASLSFFRNVLGLKVDDSRSGVWDGPFLSRLTGQEGTRDCTSPWWSAETDHVSSSGIRPHPTLPPATHEWPQPGSGHICVEVEDIFNVWEALKAADCRIVSNPPEPVPLPDGSQSGGDMLGVLDPDGHVIEILQTPRRNTT